LDKLASRAKKNQLTIKSDVVVGSRSKQEKGGALTVYANPGELAVPIAGGGGTTEAKAGSGGAHAGGAFNNHSSGDSGGGGRGGKKERQPRKKREKKKWLPSVKGADAGGLPKPPLTGVNLHTPQVEKEPPPKPKMGKAPEGAHFESKGEDGPDASAGSGARGAGGAGGPGAGGAGGRGKEDTAVNRSETMPLTTIYALAGACIVASGADPHEVNPVAAKVDTYVATFEQRGRTVIALFWQFVAERQRTF